MMDQLDQTRSSSERRQAMRVDAQLKMQVKLSRPDGSEASASLETINISTSGVYFRSDHFIEPMTKLAMALEVKVPSAITDDGADLAPVDCEGLVVRVNPECESPDCGSYEIAVFFTSIAPESVEILEQHIGLLIGSA